MSTQFLAGTQEMPLLRTKLYIPALRPGWVSRPRLVERLHAGLHNKLTLICAPAGFGKTTLVSEWVVDLVEPEVRVAWLSLDESDNDLTRFLVYLIAALQAALPAASQSRQWVQFSISFALLTTVIQRTPALA